jgi:predicted DNA-binding protein (UPF0251 family)
MSGGREWVRRDRGTGEDPGWEYLAGVPQDREYPFHSLRWEQWAARGELPLEEECAEAREAADVLRLTERLAREAKLCEREVAVLRRRVQGFSQGETARLMAVRKATLGAIWKEVRAKLAAVMDGVRHVGLAAPQWTCGTRDRRLNGIASRWTRVIEVHHVPRVHAAARETLSRAGSVTTGSTASAHTEPTAEENRSPTSFKK